MKIIKTANRTIKEIVEGLDTPITWTKIQHVSPEASQLVNMDFMEYALKSFFIDGKDDMKFCVHYYPITEQSKLNKAKDVVKTREVYKGPPTGEVNLWRTCGVIVAINAGYLWIKDRSQVVKTKYCSEPHNERGDPPREHYSAKVKEGDRCTRKPNCRGIIVENEAFPVKKLIINRIHNVTTADNTPIDFSRVLRNAAGKTGYIQELSYERANKIKQNLNKQRDNMIEQRTQELMQNNPEEQLELGKISINLNNMVSLSALSEEDLEKIQSYWDYLDSSFSEALTKSY